MLPVPESVGKIEISIPQEGHFFDYVYVFRQKGAWRFWPDVVRGMKIETDVAVQIPTIDTGRYLHILELYIKVIELILP